MKITHNSSVLKIYYVEKTKHESLNLKYNILNMKEIF